MHRYQVTPQPFYDDEHRIIATFNGEIYNYKDFGDFASDGARVAPLVAHACLTRADAPVASRSNQQGARTVRRTGDYRRVPEAR